MSDDPQDGRPVPREPLLRISKLSRCFDSGTVNALAGVTFDVGRGEFVAIMGPSGSGKSTLLNLLGGLDRPTSGEIDVDGQSVSRLKDLDQFRAQTLGFVFQSFHLLPTLTALENVQIPMFERALRPQRARGPRGRLAETSGTEPSPAPLAAHAIDGGAAAGSDRPGAGQRSEDPAGR